MAVRLAAWAMGTRFELVLAGPGGAGLDAPSLRAAGEEAIAEIRHWHDQLSAFAPGSLLNHICRVACERAVLLDDDLFELFSTAQRVCEQTSGAFDITLGPLMRAHGLRRDGRRRSAGRQSERRASVESARARTGMHLVELDTDQHTIQLHARAMELDLGAIAKGFALDRAGAVLREAGVRCGLIHGGTSSVLAIGAPPDQDAWRIAIADPATTSPVPSSPAPTLGTALAAAELRDAALGVSAPTGRLVEREGELLGHVLDPRTGEPTRSASLAAVVAPTAMLADAWSTALLVLGAQAERLPEQLDALVVSPTDPPLAHRRVLTRPHHEESAA